MTNAATRVAAGDSRFLVLAAWPPELAHLRSSLPALIPRTRQRVILASTGVGMVEAGIATARLIIERRPRIVLLIGTAGVYPPHASEFELGSAVIVRRVRLLPKILPGKHAFLPAIMPSEANSSSSLVRALREATGLPCVDVACPLGITATKQAAQTAARLSGCPLENLEAFAVARAAAAAKVPFAAILGIANRVGPAGHREWERYAKAAAENACRGALDGLKSLSSRRVT